MGVELRVTGVTKKFGEVFAVKGLEFAVRGGEFFALLGPSGAGKTTTINLIGGLETPDSGDVLVENFSIKDVKPQQRDFAMVFESYALYPHFTVAENMSFPLRSPNRATDYTEKEIGERVRETAKILEIVDLLDRFPKELSGGQKQRVGLGRALVRRPRVFLMDEPIAHLDAKLRHHMRGELKKLQKHLAITTVLATPDYNEVVAMADRAAIYSHGVIQQIGTPVELFRNPQNIIVANTIGDPPINLLDCALEKKGGAVFLKGEGFSVKCDRGFEKKMPKKGLQDGLVLGIRPSDLVIETNAQKGIIKGEVYVFEPLGGGAVATLTVGDGRMKVVCSWEERLKIGQKVGLSFGLGNMYLFEKATGRSLFM